ncbi:Phthiotriol/phenolphthiotriol dimycocerosates methyltransferase [Anatilimnocola aggregata]|uniref:Phthiotriol/phenolphthiotriol dimycocerosates methyltransferase n=2 Tax=Anatilimnocola aggregata TaxID=2528021 RepID=A0A517YMA3_9BACT|nr:Phthiotriol/phenolphthiotriol dimycocerosates methyltransferase [Anatilimnocola aggregata]
MEGLSFVVGDAENLPFEDDTFDAVVNVESSHCYRSDPAFLAQVRRVLRTGGHVLFADLIGIWISWVRGQGQFGHFHCCKSQLLLRGGLILAVVACLITSCTRDFRAAEAAISFSF